MPVDDLCPMYLSEIKWENGATMPTIPAKKSLIEFVQSVGIGNLQRPELFFIR